MRKLSVTLGLFVGIGILLLGLAYANSLRNPPSELASCPARLTKPLLEESLALGTAFMRNNQLPEGNFAYEYNWETKEFTTDDSSVRQAGALWGLTLIYAHTKDQTLVPQIERAFDFFSSRSQVATSGERYILYPGELEGKLGTVALVTLAHIEYLSANTTLTQNEREAKKEILEEYLKFITGAVRNDGGFASGYDANGAHFGAPSPYFDGESLLALVKAARYAGYPQWEEDIKRLADSGYQRNVVAALAANPDSDTTKGYYQWSSMAYFELAQSDWSETEKYGDYLIELADWMIDTHQVLQRQRNTAYAFEGIIPAYALAKERKDSARVSKYRCAIGQGLEKLISWQLGSPVANSFVATAQLDDPKATGGVQNHETEALLRIDVAQHQMHATILALRHLPF